MNHGRTLVVGVAAAALLLAGGWMSPANAGTKTFIGLLNAGQEVPPTNSDGIGVAHLTFDTKTKMLCYSISYRGLVSGEGDETQAHFHGPAPAGQNAAVLFAISPSPSALGSPKTGCVGPLSKSEKKTLQKGQIYINVHSNEHAAGEIRGQVLPIKGGK